MKPPPRRRLPRADLADRQRDLRDARTLAAAYGLSDEAARALRMALCSGQLGVSGAGAEELAAYGLLGWAMPPTGFVAASDTPILLCGTRLLFNRQNLRRLARAARAVAAVGEEPAV